MKRFYKRFLAVFFAITMAMPCVALAEENDEVFAPELLTTNGEVDNTEEILSQEPADEDEPQATLPPYAIMAEDYSNGGWAMITAPQQNIWSANSTSSTVIGEVYGGEGVTVLTQVGANLYVEYSTANGPKRGYIIGPYIDWNFLDITRVGKVNSTTTLYYGPDTSKYQVAGTVYTGEMVSVLGLWGHWVYVEYNTTSGRKRGYMPLGSVTTYGSVPLDDFYLADVQLKITGTKNVLAGPGPQYPVIGSVSNEVVRAGTVFHLYGSYAYIEYDVTGTSQKKTGYIPY